MIHDVIVSPRRLIPDDRGRIIHIMKRSDPEFQEFGEVYGSLVYPGVVKAWHLHERMTINYAVPLGLIKLALYDDREGSPSRGQLVELYVGETNHVLVHIPPGIWNGFMGVGVTPSLVINCASITHDPTEMRRLPPHGDVIPYTWPVRDR